MADTNEQRLASLEAQLAAEKEVSARVIDKLAEIERDLRKLVVYMETAKLSGRVAIGAAGVVGGVIVAVVGWILQFKK